MRDNRNTASCDVPISHANTHLASRSSEQGAAFRTLRTTYSLRTKKKLDRQQEAPMERRSSTNNENVVFNNVQHLCTSRENPVLQRKFQVLMCDTIYLTPAQYPIPSFCVRTVRPKPPALAQMRLHSRPRIHTCLRPRPKTPHKVPVRTTGVPPVDL